MYRVLADGQTDGDAHSVKTVKLHFPDSNVVFESTEIILWVNKNSEEKTR